MNLIFTITTLWVLASPAAAATLKTWQAQQIQLSIPVQNWSTPQVMCPTGQVASVLCYGPPPYPSYPGVSGAADSSGASSAKCFNSSQTSTIVFMSAVCMQIIP
ncbi:MAG: hypothetical protein AB7G93_22820 [Bdellovibrionales bacterium]